MANPVNPAICASFWSALHSGHFGTSPTCTSKLQTCYFCYPFQKYFTLLLTLPWTAAMHYWEIPMEKQIRVPGHEFWGQGISPLLRLYCIAIVTLTFCRPFVCYAFGEQIRACPWKILKLKKERRLFQLTSLSPVRDFPLDMSQGPASPHSARQPRWCVWKFVLKRKNFKYSCCIPSFNKILLAPNKGLEENACYMNPYTTVQYHSR